MKKLVLMLIAIIALAPVVVSLAATIMEGVGEHAVRRAMGTSWAVRQLNGTRNEGTPLWAAATDRVDSVCINNTAKILWLNPDSTKTGAQNEAASGGMPWLSSTTVHSEGSNTGLLTFSCGSDSQTCDVRCLDAKVP